MSAPDPAQVEALAVALYAKDKPPGESGWLTWDEHGEKVKDIWRGYAQRFLASGWLVAHDAQVRRDATREGERAAYERGVYDARDSIRQDRDGVPEAKWSLRGALAGLDELATERNPYRAEADR